MENVLQSYGLAGLVIATLSAVVLYIYKDLKAERQRNQELQEARLADAKETRDKIAEHMEEQTRMTRQIYDFILTLKRGA